jgi:hypothetical protein
LLFHRHPEVEPGEAGVVLEHLEGRINNTSFSSQAQYAASRLSL